MSRVEAMGSRLVRNIAWRMYTKARDKDELVPCEYGHLECSYTERGPCGNELEAAVIAAGEGED